MTEIEKITLQVSGAGASYADLLKNLTEEMDATANSAEVEVGSLTIKNVERRQHVRLSHTGEAYQSVSWVGTVTAEVGAVENRTEEA